MSRFTQLFSGRKSNKVKKQVRRPTRLTFEGLEERRLMAYTGISAWGTTANASHYFPSFADTANNVSNHSSTAKIAPDYGVSQVISIENAKSNPGLYDLPLLDDSTPNPKGDYLQNPIELPRLTTGLLPGLPILDSNPKANHTLYLNFTGSRSKGDFTPHENDLGGNLKDHRAPFDTDGNGLSFNAHEQEAITRIWRYVADDFAPFNVNVTTFNGDVNPSSPDDFVLEVAIGGIRDTKDDYDIWGIANAVDAYRNGKERAVYVFSDLHYRQSQEEDNSGSDYFVRSVADTISHEAGHAYGLKHHGESDGDDWIEYREPAYEQGTSLLMGRVFVKDYTSGGFRSMWSWAETAPGEIQDDLDVLTNRFRWGSANGLRKDDVADDVFRWLPEVEEGHFHTTGIIGLNPADPEAVDADWFAFHSPGGPMHLRLHSPVGNYGNLRSKIELWAAHNTPDGMVQDYLVQESSAASWQNGFGSLALPAGDYLVLVTSTGGYGNLGNYVLDVSAYAGTGGLKVGGSVTGNISGLAGQSFVASLAPSFEMADFSNAAAYDAQAFWTEGAWTDGYWTEGATAEGYWTDGVWTDGSWSDGFWTDGYWTDAASTEGSWTDGHWTDGSWIDGYWGDDAWVDGYWAEGHWTDGFWTDGVTIEGYWTDGFWTDGAWAEGYFTDGFWTDGATTDGFWTDGQWTDGYWTEAFAVVGLLDDLNWAALNPQPLPPAEAELDIAAIDQAFLAFGDEAWSGLFDDSLFVLLAEST